MRRSEPTLRLGSYQPIFAREDAWLYVRQLGDERILVALNLGDEPAAVSFASGPILGRILLSTYLDREEDTRGSVDLRSHEGVVVKLSPENGCQARSSF
jgi:alpha-glucosidase